MSGGGSSTTQVNNIPDELKPLAAAYTQKALQIGNNPYQAYTGQRFVSGQNQNQQQATGYYQNALSGGTNPYLDQMVQRAQSGVLDNYNNSIRPQLDALSARSGSFGNSGVTSTMGQQQNILGKQLNDISSQIYGQQYNADQASRQNAASSLLGIGNYQQAQAQQPLDFAYQQYQEAQNQPYRNLQAMAAPFSQNLGGSSTQQQNPSAVQNALGLALLGAQIFSASDRRIKEDIKKVGKTDEGLNVYTYKYKGDNKTQMGVMAQEVQKKHPEAVKSFGGLLAVDYSKVQ